MTAGAGRSSRPLRVGFLAADLSGDDGWARLALETVRHLTRLGGVEAVVLVDDRETRAPADDVIETVAALPLWPQHPLRWPFTVGCALPRAFRALSGCDLVHCLVEPYLPIGALWAASTGRPLVVTAVGTYAARSVGPLPWLSPFAFWARWAAIVPCISRYTEKRVLQWSPRAKTVVVNPGVDGSKFSPRPPSGRPASVPGRVLLGVGAVKPRKGYDVVVRALALLGPSFRDVELYIAGDRDTHAHHARELLRIAEDLGVGERVHLLGRVEESELLEWYRRCDLFALNASNRGEHFEGFGLSLLEANACGKAVIGCRDSGAEDIIVPGENGILVNQDDPQSTASAIEAILGDPEVVNRMGRRGRERAMELSWERSATKLLDLYRGLELTR